MQTVLLKIDGMESEADADKITDLLNNTTGVLDARISLLECMASVTIDASKTSPRLLAGVLSAAGYASFASADEPETATAGGCCGGCCGGR